MSDENTKPFHIVIALFPGVTQLDFTGPYQFFLRAPNTRVTVAALTPTLSFDGLTFSQLSSLADVPHCDLLCIPGGYGVTDAIFDVAFMAEINRLASETRYICSVCSGSIILAAAGLLKGKRAACHWAWLDILEKFPDVTIDRARVVRDGNVFTGGGVTAGIDMALTVLAETHGKKIAEGIQLMLQYSPEPPFNAGSPESAPADTVNKISTKLAEFNQANRLRIEAFINNKIA